MRNVQGNPRRELLPKTRALSAAHLEQIPANKRVLCNPLAAPHPKSGTKSPIGASPSAGDLGLIQGFNIAPGEEKHRSSLAPSQVRPAPSMVLQD